MKTQMELVGFNGIFSFINMLPMTVRTAQVDFCFFDFSYIHFLPTTTINMTLLSFACGEKNSVTESS